MIYLKKMIKNLIIIAFAMVITTAIAVTAQAEKHSSNDALATASMAIALNQAVLTALNNVPGKAVKVKFSDDDKAVWKIEVVGSDNQVYDIEIDAINGTVVKQKMDDDEDDDKDIEVKSSLKIDDNSSEIDEKIAAKIGGSEVVKAIKSHFSGKITEVKLENMNGSLVYSAEVFENGRVTNVFIDAGNGDILVSRVDNLDDGDNEDDENSKNEEHWYKFW